MSSWERWARESRLALLCGVAGTLAVPVVGVVLLRFLMTGPEVGPIPAPAPARAAVVGAPQVDPGPLPTVLPTERRAATPAAAQTQAAAAPSPTPTPSLSGEVNATDGLNVRTEPTTQGRVLRILPFLTEVELTGRSRQSEGLLWVELESGGWVQERYLDRR